MTNLAAVGFFIVTIISQHGCSQFLYPSAILTLTTRKARKGVAFLAVRRICCANIPIIVRAKIHLAPEKQCLNQASQKIIIERRTPYFGTNAESRSGETTIDFLTSPKATYFPPAWSIATACCRKPQVKPSFTFNRI